MIPTMSFFADRFNAHLVSIGWKPYTVWKFFQGKPKEKRLSENYIYEFCRGEPIKNEKVLEKLATVDGLELSLEQLRAWWLLDQVTPKELEFMRLELEKME